MPRFNAAQAVRHRAKIRSQWLTLGVLVVLLAAVSFFDFQLLEQQFGRETILPKIPTFAASAKPASAEEPLTDEVEAPEETGSKPDNSALLEVLPALETTYIDPELWNTSAPVERTINFEVLSPDYRLTAVPENEPVTMEHFSTVTFLGDSITQGLAIYETGFQNAHFCAYKNAGANSVVNRGTLVNVNGVQEVAIDALVASQPDAVYVMFGMNNLNGDGVEKSYLNYYGAMLDMLKEALDPAVQIYVETMTPTTASTGAARPNLSSQYLIFVNNQLSKLATEKGCYFIDIYESLLDETGNMNPEFAAKDGIHMNPVGYEHWVEYARRHVVNARWTKYEGSNPYTIY